MKSILSTTCVVVLLSSSLAFADTAPASPSSPSFGALPTGAIAPAPKDKAPARIPKTERVDGFFVADPPKTQLRDGKITQVLVFANENDARDFTAGKGFGFGRSGRDDVCFARRGRGGDDSGEWSFDMEPTTRINAPWKPPPPLKKGEKPSTKPRVATTGEMEVTAVHQERFVESGGKARVEATDAWVDPVTHGVRLIARSTMPLERIALAPNGLALFGARDDKQVQIVAHKGKGLDASDHPPSTPRDFRLASMERMPLMIETSTGERDASQCGFARMALKAQKGSAEMAWFETQVVSFDSPDKTDKADKADKKKGDADDPTPVDEEPTMHIRPLRASVSSTWSSRDKEPVLSVSFGWTGRERQM